MYTLNKKIINLVPYEPISGTYDIRLDANECPDNLPDNIRGEIKNEIDMLAFNRYPDPLASSVVSAFADYYGLNPDFVTAGNGSDELIFLIESAFLEKGDKMLVVFPDFSMYNFYSSICEVECDTFVKDDNLDIDVDAMIAAFDEAKTVKGKPTLVVANTTKGKGSSVMENKASWHHHVPSAEEYEQIMKDLKEREEAARNE